MKRLGPTCGKCRTCWRGWRTLARNAVLTVLGIPLGLALIVAVLMIAAHYHG